MNATLRWSLSVLVLWAVAAGVPACAGSGASERCQEACTRDAQCFEEQDDEEERAYKFDRDECEASCAFLERDSKGRQMVAAHAECVGKAADCAAVRACR